ncbi:MAG: hypothetical protein GY869_22955 [Planctomycetes bacterium]|nr:hypothetical protein [Planctomycetota bacterium]
MIVVFGKYDGPAVHTHAKELDAEKPGPDCIIGRDMEILVSADRYRRQPSHIQVKRRYLAQGHIYHRQVSNIKLLDLNRLDVLYFTDMQSVDRDGIDVIDFLYMGGNRRNTLDLVNIEVDMLMILIIFYSF